MLEAVSTLKVKNESKEGPWIAETEEKKHSILGHFVHGKTTKYISLASEGTLE